MTFTRRLQDIQTKQNSLLCIGLDTDPEKIPEHLKSMPNPVLEFNRKIIEATQDLVCAYKPNLAFYEAMGERGMTILKETLKCIPSSVLTIGDGKRGDIGNTSQRYAASLFDDYDFDSVTVNPYLGFDSIEPFMIHPEKGVFILALTSNAGSKDFQRLRVGSTPLYEKVVRRAKKWNTNQNIGLVVGATHPKELRRIRTIVPEMPILIPGVGKQGGGVQSSLRYGCNKQGQLAVINVSRSIIYASPGKDFADAARSEAKKLVEEMRTFRSQ